MTAFWFFVKLGLILALSLWISGLDGVVLVYAYGYEVHIKLWVMVVFVVLFVVLVWMVLRALGWIQSGVFYITRTRKLYKQNEVFPYIVSHIWRTNIKKHVYKPFGKKHPMGQISAYALNKKVDIDIAHILQTPYAHHMIQQAIYHNDTQKLSSIRAYYAVHKVFVPAIFYIYESLQADSLHDSLNHLSHVTDGDLHPTVCYYTAHAYVRHGETDMCEKVLRAWKSAHTDAQKWRICLLCRDIILSDVAHIVPFEKVVHKKDSMGLLLLAILSIKAQLWGPADSYISQSETYLTDYTEKQRLIKAYLTYKKYGDGNAYIQHLNKQNKDIII